MKRFIIALTGALTQGFANWPVTAGAGQQAD
jgi:hypothetical protein